MIKITILVASLFFAGLSGCSDDRRTPPDDGDSRGTLGTRSYKLDPGAAAMQISVYGVYMGTPDAAKFRFLMQTLKNAGEFVSLTERAPGIEGGGIYCGVFSATANQGEIYELIRSIETDPKQTEFTAVSVSSCASDGTQKSSDK